MSANELPYWWKATHPAKEYGSAYSGDAPQDAPQAEPTPSWHKGTTPQPAAQADPALVPPKQWYQKPVTWIAGGVAALILVISLASGGADDKFIDRLDEGGIYYSSEAKAIKAGKSVCAVLDEGYSVTQAAAQAANGTGWSLYDAGYIVGASVYAYCPEYGKQIQ